MADGVAPDLRPLDARQFLCPLELLFPSPTDPRGGDVGDLSDLDVGELGPDGQPIPIFEALWVRTRERALAWVCEGCLEISLAHGDAEGDSEPCVYCHDLAKGVATVKLVDTYEIIRGHRRTAKARLKGLTHAPVELHDELDDEAVRMLQLREVLQRQQLTPMQQARAFGAMRDELKIKPAEIAARLNLKERHVHERLVLLTLSPEAQKAIAEGSISLGVAVHLSTLSAEKQAVAVVTVQHMTAHSAIGWIRSAFHLTLWNAKFDPTDARLVEGAPACGVCPKNTAVQTDLFEVQDGDARCLDSACYGAKEKAAKAKVDGHARREDAPAPAKPIELARGPSLVLKPSPRTPAKSPPSLTMMIEDATEQLLLGKIADAALKRKTDTSLLRFMIMLAVLGTDADALDPILRRHAWANVGEMQRIVAKADEEFARAVLLELYTLAAFARPTPLREQLEDKDGLLAVLCRGLKINGKKLCDDAEADVRAEQPETKARKAARAAKEKPLPTKAAPKPDKLVISVRSFRDEVETWLAGGNWMMTGQVAAHIARLLGIKALTESAAKILEKAYADGVKRGTFELVGERVRLAEKAAPP